MTWIFDSIPLMYQWPDDLLTDLFLLFVVHIICDYLDTDDTKSYNVETRTHLLWWDHFNCCPILDSIAVSVLVVNIGLDSIRAKDLNNHSDTETGTLSIQDNLREDVYVKCSFCCPHEKEGKACDQVGDCRKKATINISLIKSPEYLFIQLKCTDTMKV